MIKTHFNVEDSVSFLDKQTLAQSLKMCLDNLRTFIELNCIQNSDKSFLFELENFNAFNLQKLFDYKTFCFLHEQQVKDNEDVLGYSFSLDRENNLIRFNICKILFEKDLILGVACKDENENVYTMPCPFRHHHLIHSLGGLKVKQGFYSTKKDFLTREEALFLAKQNDQIISNYGVKGLDKLYSENLWR